MIAAGEPSAGSYLVTWSGHGDATALWRQEADGTLTLANSFTYGTWGSPSVAAHNGIADLGFRFRYVGEFDVQWDNDLGLGLYYMHARHYSPVLGRFLQPDPDGSEDNLYAYTANTPVTELDPDGTCFILCIAVGVVLFGGLMAGTRSAQYATGTELERSGSLAEAAGNGFIEGGLLAVPAPGLGRAGSLGARLLGKALSKVPKAARAAVARAGRLIPRGRATTDFVATNNSLVHVRPTIDRIRSGVRLPFRNDGTVFRNKEGLLPRRPLGWYREYVHPTPGVAGPGAQRIVRSLFGGLYYTPNHYKRFIPLN